MGKSHKSKQQPKEPKKSGRKTNNRQCLKKESQDDGDFYHREIRNEKENNELLSPAQKAPTHALHQCLSRGDFKQAGLILKDSNLDSEHKKHAAVTYKCNVKGTTPFHEAIKNNAPYDLVELLTFIGGADAVIAENDDGHNVIHLACKLGASSEIVDVLCFMGKEAVNKQDRFGDLPIHKASRMSYTTIAVVKKLLHHGGREMLEIKNHDGHLPVHSCVYFNTNLEVCKQLVIEGLHWGVGGEEGLGGLNVEYQDMFNKKKTTLEQLKRKNLSKCLLKEIKDVVSQKYQSTILESGAKHGLQWHKGMDDLVEESDSERIKLGIVALAASGNKSDLSSIYQLCLRYTDTLFS